ncbi:MAG: hypothetical protein BV458_13510 [Thermoplasmata archaeon M9B2D]|nr:MAG: hypothetical protein BV458_13510 [Thermoplasmata archaeon M9B2D]
MTGIIAGSGFSGLDGSELIDKMSCENMFGKPSGRLEKYGYNGKEFIFLSRHGNDHSIPPHKVNYRANIKALKDSGVTDIISISAVGGITNEFAPGKIIIADQIIDFTRSRQNTFFDEQQVVHIDFTEPYCARLRSVLIDAADKAGIQVLNSGVYVAVEGPRLETSAEIAMFRNQGGNIVGMTAMPEAALVREAEICYTGVYVVTNHAAGVAHSRLTTDEVISTMKASTDTINILLSKVLGMLLSDDQCQCRSALKEARM